MVILIGGKMCKDIIKIKKITEEGQEKEIEVDFSKLPCSKCERRYHPTCPKPDCWNKDGKYMVY